MGNPWVHLQPIAFPELRKNYRGKHIASKSEIHPVITSTMILHLTIVRPILSIITITITITITIASYSILF